MKDNGSECFYEKASSYDLHVDASIEKLTIPCNPMA